MKNLIKSEGKSTPADHLPETRKEIPAGAEEPIFYFETLPDETHVITVKSKNTLGETVLRQGVIDSLSVFNSVKEALQKR